MRQLFVDCDGVLADFDKHFEDCFKMKSKQYEDRYGSADFWATIRKGTDSFFLNLPLMVGAKHLMDSVSELRPIILTGCPLHGWAEPQKLAWAREQFRGTPMITCLAKNKREYCRPGDVLVDDMLKYKNLWESAQGVFIHHTDVDDSIVKIKQIFDKD